MLELLDIFAPVSEAPPSANPWDLPGAGGRTQAVGPLRVDAWDSMGIVHVLITRRSQILMKWSKKDISLMQAFFFFFSCNDFHI